ncbi:MAG: hypothetical protein QXI09_02675 [Candidatus Aenigmatarchaeota archaeon]
MVERFSARRQSESLYDIVSELLEKEEVRKLLSQLEDAAKEGLLNSLNDLNKKINDYLSKKLGEAAGLYSEIGWKIFLRGSVPIEEVLSTLDERINDYQSKLREKANMISSLEKEFNKKMNELSEQLYEVENEKYEWNQSALTLDKIIRQGLRSTEEREWAEKETRNLEQRYNEIRKKEEEIQEKIREILFNSLVTMVQQKAEERYLEKNLNDLIILRDYLQQLKKKQNIDKLTTNEWMKVGAYVLAYKVGQQLGEEAKNRLSSYGREETYGRGKRNYLLLIIVGLASSLATLHFVDFSMKGMFLIQPHVSIAYLILSSILLATLLYLIFKKK